MKKLRVTLKAEIILPDKWELVDHGDHYDVLKVGNKYCDFNLMCMSTKSRSAGTHWTSDDKLTDLMLSGLTTMETQIEEIEEHITEHEE